MPIWETPKCPNADDVHSVTDDTLISEDVLLVECLDCGIHFRV